MDHNETGADDRLWDLLADWEAAFLEGRDLPAEELCRHCPHLLGPLEERITTLKQTAWMTRRHPEVDAPATPQGPFDRTPASLGEYTILERLGIGGMGAIFLALHRRMDRLVVLKLLPRSSPEAARRFQEEVEAAAKLVHPNIVTAYDAGESDGIPFLAMEFVRGVDLHDYVQQHGPLAVDQATDFLLQAAKGLEYAHGKGIIHGDIKPGNLLLSADGTVRILDMGLAQIRTPVPAPKHIGGTPDYMAPEAAQGAVAADGRADLYSLGCTLWFLLTGRSLFADATTVIQKIVAHRDRPAPSLKAARCDVPDALDAIFQKLVAKRPDERFASATEVVKSLSGFQRRLYHRRRGWLGWLSGSTGRAARLVLAAGTLIACLGVLIGLGAHILPLLSTPSPPTTGAIQLTIEPEDSAVYLDGAIADPAGPADMVFADLSPGTHEIRIVRDGLKPYVMLVEARAGETVRKTIRLAEVQALTNTAGIKLVLIPAGTFQMGAGDSPPHGPRHQVDVSQFYLGACEVTQRQFTGVMGFNPSLFNERNGGGPDHPVEMVTWDQAVEFCTKLSEAETGTGRRYRLPTEAEWEYACRAGTTTAYSFGDDFKGADHYAWYGANAGKTTHPVGGKKPNAWGLYDMNGNVWEWCSDWYDARSYTRSGRVNPTGPAQPVTEVKRVIRGGCWADKRKTAPNYFRSAFRFPEVSPSVPRPTVGFRVVMVPSL